MPGRRVSVWECFCRIVGLEGEMSFKVGGKPPTPPFFLFFSLFFSFEGRASVQDQKEDEGEEEGAIWRAGSRHALLMCTSTTKMKKMKPTRRSKKKGKRKKEPEDEAMKRAGRRRGHQTCTITTVKKRSNKKVVPSWIFFACGGPNNKGDPGSPSKAFARTKTAGRNQTEQPRFTGK